MLIFVLHFEIPIEYQKKVPLAPPRVKTGEQGNEFNTGEQSNEFNTEMHDTKVHTQNSGSKTQLELVH